MQIDEEVIDGSEGSEGSNGSEIGEGVMVGMGENVVVITYVFLLSEIKCGYT